MVPAAPQQAVPYPLGLSQDQVDSLRSLRSTPQWRSYSEALAAVSERELGRIVRGLPHDEYLIACGRFQAVEAFLTVIDHVDQKAREMDEHRAPAVSQRTADTDRTNLTFAGSPFWDAVRKRAKHFGPDSTNGKS